MSLGLYTEDEDCNEKATNSYENFMSELDLSIDPPKMPELFCSVKSYNKKTSQNEFANKIRGNNRTDAKVIELTKALKLDFDYPTRPQLFVNKKPSYDEARR